MLGFLLVLSLVLPMSFWQVETYRHEAVPACASMRAETAVGVSAAVPPVPATASTREAF